MSALTNLVLEKIRALPSLEAAADFFRYNEDSISLWLTGGSPVPLDAVEKVFDVTKLAPKVGDMSFGSQKVCVMLPWYKQTNPATAFSVMSCLDRTKMTVMLNFGDAFIAHTRNQLATQFLKTPLEWAITIDDDSILPCGNSAWFNSYSDFELPERFASLNAITRLMSHGKTLVGALYFGRWKKGKPVFGEGHDKATERYARGAPYDKVVPTKWIGTGCLLIHRSVFLAIEDRFPYLARNKDGDRGNWFTSSEHDLQQACQKALGVLNDDSTGEGNRIQEAKRLMEEARDHTRRNSALGHGEDVAFSIRASQAGHTPHVDLGLIVGHQGSFVYGPKRAGWVKE